MTLLDATNSIKYFELLTFIIGFLNYRKLKGTVWQYLPFFLMLVFFLECIGYFLTEIKNYPANILLYKYIVIPLIFYFYNYIFIHILSRIANKIVIIGGVTFTVSLFIEYFVLESYHTFYASLSLSIANLFTLVYALIYYVELVNSDDLIAFKRSISFWFVTGVLIFYLGCLPYFGLYNILAQKYHETIFLPYTWVFVLLNYVMYTFFTIGFLWNKKKS